MKVVLSRKGMDSRAGGIPSPILPDGMLLSLPIPNEKSGVPYDALVYSELNNPTYERGTEIKIRTSFLLISTF